MGDWPELGERLRQRIRELGYPNPAQFADAKGYRVTYVYKWIDGQFPSRANLERLAKDLDTSPVWLMFGVEDRPARKLAPIGGGSSDEGTLPLCSPDDVLRLLGSWLRRLFGRQPVPAFA